MPKIHLRIPMNNIFSPSNYTLSLKHMCSMSCLMKPNVMFVTNPYIHTITPQLQTTFHQFISCLNHDLAITMQSKNLINKFWLMHQKMLDASSCSPFLWFLASKEVPIHILWLKCLNTLHPLHAHPCMHLTNPLNSYQIPRPTHVRLKNISNPPIPHLTNLNITTTPKTRVLEPPKLNVDRKCPIDSCSLFKKVGTSNHSTCIKNNA